jgi:hypothetical protein
LPAAIRGRAGRRAAAAGQGFVSEGSMRRDDWIYDVLCDLQDYALANDMVELAASIEATLKVARRDAFTDDDARDQGSDRSARLQ